MEGKGAHLGVAVAAALAAAPAAGALHPDAMEAADTLAEDGEDALGSGWKPVDDDDLCFGLDGYEGWPWGGR
jgi:hypothetical protein